MKIASKLISHKVERTTRVGLLQGSPFVRGAKHTKRALSDQGLLCKGNVLEIGFLLGGDLRPWLETT